MIEWRRPLLTALLLVLFLALATACQATEEEEEWLDLLLEWSSVQTECGVPAPLSPVAAASGDSPCERAARLHAGLRPACDRLRLGDNRCEQDLAQMRDYVNALIRCRSGPNAVRAGDADAEDACLKTQLPRENKFRPE